MRRLRRSKGDLALLEGPHLLAEALAAGIELEDVFCSPGYFAAPSASTAADADAELRQILAGLSRPPTEVAAEVLGELADADSPRGLVATARLPRGGVESLPPISAGRARGGGIYVWVEGLQDPGNLGALARSAEAAGATALALAPGTVHPNHPRALRAAAGSLLRLPVAIGVTIGDLDEYLAGSETGGRGTPPRWLALATHGGDDLWAAPLEPPLVVALGAEGPGLSPAAAARADVQVTIPLAAPVESLNATVAASLVLFEIRRRGSSG